MRRRKAIRGKKTRQMLRRELRPALEPDTDDPKVQRGCVGKKEFLNKHRARIMISRIRKTIGKEQRAYHCRSCGKYHLASVKEAEANEPLVTAEITTPIPPARSLAGVNVKQMVKRVEA